MPQSPLGNVPAGKSTVRTSPAITSILTVPGLDTIGQLNGAILVGIIIDGSSIAWAKCQAFSSVDLPHFQDPYSAEDGIASIEDTVAPALLGQELTSFRHLANLLESLRERVTITRPMPQPQTQSQGVSRRAIISGFLASSQEDKGAPQVEEVTIERAIHPAVRHGLSQALLKAVAMTKGLTPVEVIAGEFELPVPSTAVALQMPIKRGQRLQLYDSISTLAYAVGRGAAEDSLGPNGARIQRFIRKLRQSLTEAGRQDQITIHLDVAGGLGQVFDQDVGKVLGALYGLQQAAAPCLIRVQDPVIMADLDAQVEALVKLRDYMRMRAMSLQLVASAGIQTLADVQTFARAGAAHLIHLKVPQLGTVQELVVASQECRAHGTGIMLEAIPSPISSQVALAIQPDVLTYPIAWPAEASIAAFHNEMARTLTWLAKKAA